MVDRILYSFFTSHSDRCKLAALEDDLATLEVDLATLEVDLSELEVKIQDVQGSIHTQGANPQSFFDRYIAPFIELITNSLFCSSNLKKRDIIDWIQ